MSLALRRAHGWSKTPNQPTLLIHPMNRLAIPAALGAIVLGILFVNRTPSHDATIAEAAPVRPSPDSVEPAATLELAPSESTAELREEAAQSSRAEEPTVSPLESELDGDIARRVLRCIPVGLDRVPIDSPMFRFRGKVQDGSVQRELWSAKAIRRASGGIEAEIPLKHAFEDIELLTLENLSRGSVARMTVKFQKRLARHPIEIERSGDGTLVEVLDIGRFAVQRPSDIHEEPLYSGKVVGPNGEVVSDLTVLFTKRTTESGFNAVGFMDVICDEEGNFEFYAPTAVATCSWHFDSQEFGSLFVEDQASPDLGRQYRLPGMIELRCDWILPRGVDPRAIWIDVCDLKRGMPFLNTELANLAAKDWKVRVPRSVVGSELLLRWGNSIFGDSIEEWGIPEPIGNVADLGVIDLTTLLQALEVAVVDEDSTPLVNCNLSIQLRSTAVGAEVAVIEQFSVADTNDAGAIVLPLLSTTRSVSMRHAGKFVEFDVDEAPSVVTLTASSGGLSKAAVKLKELGY